MIGNFVLFYFYFSVVFNCIHRNDYYGGLWASFSLDALQQLPKNQQFTLDKNQNINEELTYFGNNFFGIENFVFNWHIPK